MNLFVDILLPLLIGAAVPIGLLAYCIACKDRKNISFKTLLYGFGSFFAAIGVIFIIFLFVTNVMSVTLSVSAESNVNTYLFVGGAVLLLVFYLVTEALKILSFKMALKSEKNHCAGVLFGSGFILAQNVLVLILCHLSDMSGNASLYFGILMLISSLIYIIISIMGYHMVRDGQLIAGSALALIYYIMYAIMLIVSNVIVTYVMFALVLLFVATVAYFTLPLPFKKEANS